MKIEFRGYDLEVEVTFYTPGNPGVTSGPPENCYPPEAEEIDWKIKDDDNLAATFIYENDELHQELTQCILETIQQEQIDALEEEADNKYQSLKDEKYGY